MRLINASTCLLEDFTGKPVPPYAILSHTWDQGEVTFQDMHRPDKVAQEKKGYQKIANTCALTIRQGLTHAWIDTCCIDKSSSSELSEAINSMLKWYMESDVCFAYFSDFDITSTGERDVTSEDLAKLRWFYRGWTLQELVAPRHVYFFDFSWKYFGSKYTLISDVSSVTGIDEHVLNAGGDSLPAMLRAICIAQKMSWAARRETTRIEDMAYSLIGLFDINMPLLYGEGKKAFTRLQEELIKNSNDLTIFAWTNDDRLGGALAVSPANFSSAGSIIPTTESAHLPTYTITNKGLLIEATGYSVAYTDEFWMDLHCIDIKASSEGLGISLIKQTGDTFIRSGEMSGPTTLKEAGDFYNDERVTIKIYIRTSSEVYRSGPKVKVLPRIPRVIKFQGELNTKWFTHVSSKPQEKWIAEDAAFLAAGYVGFVGIHLFQWTGGSREKFVMACGLCTGRSRPWACFASARQASELYDAAIRGDIQAVRTLGPSLRGHHTLRFEGEDQDIRTESGSYRVINVEFMDMQGIMRRDRHSDLAIRIYRALER